MKNTQKFYMLCIMMLVITIGTESIKALNIPKELKIPNNRNTVAKNAKKSAAAKQKTTDAATCNAQIAALQQQSFLDQFNTLAAAGIAQISPAQIATIATSLIPFITNDQIAEFTAIQIPAFTATQIPAFSPTQIAAFTITGSQVDQVAAFTAAQVAVFTAPQIAAMSVAQINEIITDLSKAQVQCLVQAQIQGLSPAIIATIVAELNPAQLQCITLPQLAELGANVAPVISSLSAAQFLSLSQAQIQLMTNQNISDQLANLSAQQIGYLLPEQIATITTDQINKMTKDQLLALQTILSNSVIMTTANDPALTTQIAAVTKAGVPVSAVPATDTGSGNNSKKKNNDPKYATANFEKQIKIGNADSLYQINKDSKLAKTNEKSEKDLKKIGKKLKKTFHI